MENNDTIDIIMSYDGADFENTSDKSKKEILDVFTKLMLIPKQHLTSAPTFTPKNFYEQIQLYDDATNRRLYLYTNNTWRYITLT